MNTHHDTSIPIIQKAPKAAILSLILGIGSLAVLSVAIPLGFLVPSVGIISFFGPISILAVAAIFCGVLGRKKTMAEKLPGKKAATTGFVLGIIALSLVVILRVIIFLFFITWLGA